MDETNTPVKSGHALIEEMLTEPASQRRLYKVLVDSGAAPEKDMSDEELAAYFAPETKE